MLALADVPREAIDTGYYELSAWVLHKDIKNPDALLFLDITDENSETTRSFHQPVRFQCFQIDNNWARVRIRFRINNSAEKLGVFGYEPDRHKGNVIFDNIMIRKIGAEVVSPSVYEDEIMINNYIIGNINDH